jgi:hypothetical protein
MLVAEVVDILATKDACPGQGQPAQSSMEQYSRTAIGGADSSSCKPEGAELWLRARADVTSAGDTAVEAVEAAGTEADADALRLAAKLAFFCSLRCCSTTARFFACPSAGTT